MTFVPTWVCPRALPLWLILTLASVANSVATEVALSNVAVRPEQVTPMAASTLFVSQDEGVRYTLWTTDGTPQGTQLLLDPCPDPCDGSYGIQILGSTPDGRAYFTAYDSAIPASTFNLWVTNGTVGGTHPILQGSQLSGLHLGEYSSFAIIGSRLLFRKETHGEAVWVTDGTPGAAAPLGGVPPAQDFDRIYFCARDARLGYFIRVRIGEGTTVFRTDGTPAGTPISAPPESYMTCSAHLSAGRMWGAGSVDGGAEPRFIVTDGSIEGSMSSGPLPGFPQPVEVGSDAAIFLLREGDEAIPSLWTSDGTPAGTRRLKQGAAWESFDYYYQPDMFEIVRPFVYYLYNDASGALEARRVRLDGSDDRLIHRLCERNCGYASEWSWIERVGNQVVFPAQTPSSGLQLFRLDAGGTLPVELAPPCSSLCEYQFEYHQVIGSRLLFIYWDDESARELLAYDPASGPWRVLSNFFSGAPFRIEPRDPPLVITAAKLLTPAVEDGSTFLRLFALPAFDVCRASSHDLCVRDERFRIAVRWRDFAGREGGGHALPLTTDTGYFWFFDDANVELTVKVIDGTGLNGHFWVYYGALSNVEYWITVEDTVTGESKQYHNALGQFGSFGDIEALPAELGAFAAPADFAAESTASRGAAPAPNPLAVAEFGSSGTCIPTPTSLCLLDGRFQVEADWTDFAGHSGVAYVQQLTPDTGYFWFFSESNVEVVAKLVDGSAFNQHFWVYYGALSNVEYTLTVTDTVAGGPPRIYHNPLGRFGSFGDIEAFPAP